MALTGDSTAHFTELEPEELEEYRPINRMALMGLVLGLFSPIALLHLALCLIPALGSIFSLIGLRQLGQAELRQSGRSLAVLGLLLSLLFASWAVARQTSRQNYMYGQARLFAESWLELLRDGKYEEAHQLTLHEGMRIERGQSLDKHYAPKARPSPDQARQKADPKDPGAADDMLKAMEPTPREAMEGFYGIPEVQRVRNLGQSARFRFVSNLRIGPAGASAERIDLMYEASGNAKGISTSFPFIVSLERSTLSGPAGDWRVEGLHRAEGK